MNNRVKAIIKRYRIFLLLVVVNVVIGFFFPQIGSKSFQLTWASLVDMISILPPILLLLGLLDVWVKRETMVKYMGEGSGLVGVLIAFLIGSAAAGPLYVGFPVAGVLLKKGSKLSNVFIMVGAWSTTKIPLVLFEASSLGPKFMLVRLGMDLIGIAVIAYITERVLTISERDAIQENALHIN